MEYLGKILQGVSMGAFMSVAMVVYSEIKIGNAVADNNLSSKNYLDDKFNEKEKADSLRAIAFYDALAVDRGLKVDYERIERANEKPIRELRGEMQGLANLVQTSLLETFYQDTFYTKDKDGWYYFFKWTYDPLYKKMILVEY